MADTPLFQVGGLASGLDTQSIIDGLTRIEQQPLDTLRTQQTDFKTQISVIGQLVGKIQALQSAAKTLSTTGVVGTKATTVNTDFTAVPSPQTQAGSYQVSVQSLATAAQSRTAGFTPDASGNTAVKGGTLTLTVQGKTYDPITITDGESLGDVAGAIRALGAPVSAVVLNNGTQQFLSVTDLNTGFTGADNSTALQIAENSTGTQGQSLGFAQVGTGATNALVTVDGLQFTRQTNTITDAIPGTTLTLKGKTNTTETLSVANDSATTGLNLQNFVNAYNDIVNFMASQQTQVSSGTDRAATLAGNSTLRSLTHDMQTMMTSIVGSGTIRTLADIGLKTNFQDGTLTIDSGRLGAALAANPQAINQVFSDPVSGIGKAMQTLSDRYTNVVDGLFTNSTKTLSTRIKQMDTQADSMQARVDAFKANLTAQFTAMEQIVSQLKTTGNFLTQHSAAAAASSSG
jgi:flagellar hook-associated protein 2